MPDTLRCLLRTLLVLGLLIGVISTRFSPGQAPVGKRYALVVGINKYEHGDLDELKVAENDARVLAKELESLGYQVVRLLGKEATKAVIEKNLGEVCDRARQGDQVLISLAGHGFQFIETDVAYFCPSDGRPFKERAETLVSMATVYSKLKTSFAGDKLLLLDACRTDPGVRGRSGIDAESAPVPFGVAALYACAPGQKAQEDEKLGHGVFTYTVLQGLRGAAKDPESGEVDFAGLGRYVQKQTPLLAAMLKGSPQQTPTLEARYKRTPVLVPRSAATADAPTLKAPFGDREIAAARSAWGKKLGVPTEPELDLGDGVKVRFVLIPPGEFDMGASEEDQNAQDDETPRRRVRFTYPFFLQTTETTQAQYVRLTGKANPSWFSKTGTGKEAIKNQETKTFPVEQVNHSEALAACQAAAVQARKQWLPEKWSGSLPREAEWEYACRAGKPGLDGFGKDTREFARYAWFSDFVSDDLTHSVGEKLPNQFGLFDILGNVSEWCEDWYDERYYRRGENENPRGPLNGKNRVMRGGSFDLEPKHCRQSARYHLEPGDRFNFLGFRICFRAE